MCVCVRVCVCLLWDRRRGCRWIGDVLLVDWLFEGVLEGVCVCVCLPLLSSFCLACFCGAVCVCVCMCRDVSVMWQCNISLKNPIGIEVSRSD